MDNHQLQQNRFRISAWVILVCALFSGCIGASRRDSDRPLPTPKSSATPPAEYREAVQSEFNVTTEKSESAEATELLGAWWEIFSDSQLSQMIELALQNNLTLQEAWTNIEQAEEALIQSRAAFRPTADARANVQKRWITPQDETIRNRGNDTSVGATFNWELDLWGRLRAARDARIQQRNAAVADWKAARLDLSTAVARTYFAIQEQRLQLKLNQSQVESNLTLLDLTRLRFAQGQSSIVDVLQQKDQLAATQVNQPGIEARLKELQYAMDVLLSEEIGYTESCLQSLDELPPPPSPQATRTPTTLLLQRPDLLSLEAEARAINARVAEAIANRFPRINLGASLSGVGDPTPSSMIATIFATVAGPIFDGGLRRSEVRQRKAQFEGLIYRYSQAFLSAVRDVETGLVNLRQQQETLLRLEARLKNAQRLLTESQNRYSQGLTDYLPTLTAIVTEQNLRRQWLTRKREALTLYIGLCSSQGGPVPDDQFLPEENRHELQANAREE